MMLRNSMVKSEISSCRDYLHLNNANDQVIDYM